MASWLLSVEILLHNLVKRATNQSESQAGDCRLNPSHAPIDMISALSGPLHLG